MTMTGNRELSITRVFDAPRELVFRAWTDPAHLAAWFGPQGCTTPLDTVSTDVRPGGRWRATMVRDDNGEQYPTGGTYREVDPPSRLVFTWTDPTAPVGRPAESLVTIDLVEQGGKTEMTFVQTGFRTDGEHEGARRGWGSGFEKLAAHVAGAAR